MSDFDFEYEPVRGLPGLLPPGEKVLWQGAPDWLLLARGPFFGDWVAIYFAALIAWRFADGLANGVPAGVAWSVSAGLIPLAVVALAVIALVAWATARTTVYTVTSRRVVLRIGVALSMSVNVPFKRVAAASVKPLARGHGEIALDVGGKDRFGYLVLWPHARPWRLARPQPMLRALADVGTPARILGEALAAYQAELGMEIDAAAPAATRPAAKPGAPGLVPAE